MTRLQAVCGAVLVVGALATTTGAQPQQPDVLSALLTEVRALRVAMEQMASAGPRVQLALGRLQLQEQRINTMARRLESLRDQRTSLERELDAKQLQVKVIAAGDPPSNPAQREMHDEMVTTVRSELARLTAEIQRLTLEESDLSGQIGAEQGRWTLINQQLEELERGLARR